MFEPMIRRVRTVQEVASYLQNHLADLLRNVIGRARMNYRDMMGLHDRIHMIIREVTPLGIGYNIMCNFLRLLSIDPPLRKLHHKLAIKEYLTGRRPIEFIIDLDSPGGVETISITVR